MPSEILKNQLLAHQFILKDSIQQPKLPDKSDESSDDSKDSSTEINEKPKRQNKEAKVLDKPLDQYKLFQSDPVGQPSDEINVADYSNETFGINKSKNEIEVSTESPLETD